jgi:hypothetical protein
VCAADLSHLRDRRHTSFWEFARGYNANMKRFRIGLRMMLLVVALFAVCFAWIGARRELQRVRIHGELQSRQLDRQLIFNWRDSFTSEEAWRARLAEMDAEIAKTRKQLGESVR